MLGVESVRMWVLFIFLRIMPKSEMEIILTDITNYEYTDPAFDCEFSYLRLDQLFDS